ncbi:MAG: hypothetical protein GY742_04870 [Hyphomicrobiales bacterium]|nr:hypothetical protein [Hyphomicrobiales bacterium]
MYKITDWLEKHRVSAKTIQDIIVLSRAGFPAVTSYSATRSSATENLAVEISCFEQSYHKIVVPALEHAFKNQEGISTICADIQFHRSSRASQTRPCTIDNGKNTPPTIVMDWEGTPGNLICLAHETAHALQIILSNHALMPPIARETCAFLGELFLIDYARHRDANLYEQLRQVWDWENETYLATYRNELTLALNDQQTPYHYNLNYPIARLAAMELFRSEGSNWLNKLFSSGANAMKFLPLKAMAGKTMPGGQCGAPVDIYRSVGTIVLLHINNEDYYMNDNIGSYQDRLNQLVKNSFEHHHHGPIQ